MGTRTVVGTVLIVVVAGVCLLDWHLERSGRPAVRLDPAGPETTIRALPLAALMLVLIAAGYLELAGLAAATGVDISRFSGMVCAMILGTLPFWRQGLAGGAAHLALVVLGVAVMVLFAEQIVRRQTQDAIRRVGVGLLGVCYLGVCGAVVLSIRMQFGLKALVLFLVAVKVTDIAAYFSGTAVGRHKLIPWLSPGKTWEGLFGGLAGAAVAAVAFVAVVNPVFGMPDRASMSYVAAALFAVVVGAIGQGADLCESLLKRDAGSKDAGSSVPGFGGVLDVLDSPLLAAPAGYVMLALLR